jgi:uroporphyrinogen III methyltransferase/synthase
VGSGPGDPGLLTTRAAAVLANAALVFTDPDVPEPVLALIGKDLPPVSGPVPAEPAAASADAASGAPDKENAQAVVPGGPDIRPALGDPAEVAKTLTAEARSGADVVRLVAGDPLTVDAVITEVNAVARTHLHIEIVPGLAATSAVPTYAGLPLGSSHTVADVRGDVDWEALAAAPGPLILQATASHLADAARTLIDHELAETTPCVVTAQGTTCQQRSVETTLQGLTDPAVLGGGTDPAGLSAASGRGPRFAGEGPRFAGEDPQSGPLVVTIGKTVASRAKLNWWESRALYGWTVLVPRTKDQAGEMSARLTSYGALPVEVPTIAVEPPRSPAQMERAVKGLVDGRFQWVVFTSTNAVRAVWEKFGEFGLDARAFSGVKIACVGESTADRVRAFGISPELVPAGEQSSLGLLDEFPPYDSVFDPVNRVLLPRADIATETLAEGLRERGWEIEDVTAYRTVRAAPPPAATREMIKTGGFDAVCFTSSSTVRNLVGIAGKPHARTIIACIGPKTAETAAEFGLRVDVQPDTAAVGPLVDALAEHAARLRAEGALPPPRKKSRRR